MRVHLAVVIHQTHKLSYQLTTSQESTLDKDKPVQVGISNPTQIPGLVGYFHSKYIKDSLI